VRELVEADQRVQQDPAPIVRVTGVVDDAAVISVWFWTAAAEVQAVAADAYLRTIDALNETGLSALYSPERSTNPGPPVDS
jgi:small-conductance mechanosensitive channel